MPNTSCSAADCGIALLLFMPTGLQPLLPLSTPTLSPMRAANQQNCRTLVQKCSICTRTCQTLPNSQYDVQYDVCAQSNTAHIQLHPDQRSAFTSSPDDTCSGPQGTHHNQQASTQCISTHPVLKHNTNSRCTPTMHTLRVAAPPPAAQTTPAAAPKARTTTSKPASTSKATPAKGHASHAGNGSAHAANGAGHAGAPGEGERAGLWGLMVSDQSHGCDISQANPTDALDATPAKGHASHAGCGSAHAANGAGASGEGEQPGFRCPSVGV